jgi:hypothetical protein
MPAHIPFYLAGKGVILAGKGAILAGKGVIAATHAVSHAIAAHAALSAEAVAATGVAGVVAVAYLDHQEMQSWFVANEASAPIAIERSARIAIGGGWFNGEFTTKIQGPPSLVLQGYLDKQSGEVTKYRIIRPTRMEPELATSLSDGKMLVYA